MAFRSANLDDLVRQPVWHTQKWKMTGREKSLSELDATLLHPIDHKSLPLRSETIVFITIYKHIVHLIIRRVLHNVLSAGVWVLSKLIFLRPELLRDVMEEGLYEICLGFENQKVILN